MARKISVAVAGLVSVALLLSVVLGALLVQEQFSNHAAIRVNGNISLWQDAACTQRLTSLEWGDSFTANQTVDKIVYLKSDANFRVYIGWQATGFSWFDDASGHNTGFYFNDASGSGKWLTDADFYFQVWANWGAGNLQWRPDSGLQTMNVGAVIPLDLRLCTCYNPEGGAPLDFTVIVSSYSTSGG